MSQRLCAVCNRIFASSYPIPQRISHTPHHSTLGDFLEAANEGCYICQSITKTRQWSVIYYLFSKGVPITFEARLDFRYVNGSQSNFGVTTVTAVCDIDDEYRLRLDPTVTDLNELKEQLRPRTHLWAKLPSYKFDFRFYLRPVEIEPIGGHDYIATPSSVQSDPAMMGLLKYWSTECCNNHSFCLPPNPSFSPTRIVLIENEHSARVVETKDWTIHHPYVALSHCWGKANRLKLQKSNMMDMLKHLSITELPTTYKEGISVAFALGYSYIWIDSLCIIQDDEEDWTKEAAMMKDVFENCSINLSATAAADSSQSSFRYRDPAMIPPLEVTLNREGEKPEQAKFWLTMKWVDLRREDIVYSPLHSRAWVFQEANLSRRRIDLARSQMWWFCQQNWACETHPSGVWDVDQYEWLKSDSQHYLNDSQQYFNMRRRRNVDPNALLYMSSLRGPSSQTPATVASSNTSPEENHQRHWREQVRVYTNCDITETKDRLIAFAGIAQRYAQGRGRSLDDYLAGIWRQELPHSLCFSSTHEKPSYRPDEYRAPSWSWASLEGPVDLEKYRLPLESPRIAPLSKVVSAKVIHQFDRYQAGGVKGGVIHLKGHLVEWILGNQIPKWPNDKRFKGLATEEIRTNDFDERRNVKDSITPHPAVSYLEHPQDQLDQRKEGIVDGAVRRSITFQKPNELSEHIRLFMLPILRNDRSILVTGVPCLILCQSIHDCLGGKDIYQRVGIYQWSIFLGDMEKGLLEDLDTIPERDVYII